MVIIGEFRHRTDVYNIQDLTVSLTISIDLRNLIVARTVATKL